MSKWVAVEKEPLIFENDKEGQNKHYLSYSKLPALDKKWQNRDINVVERVTIPIISKLDDIMTPLKLFELFFDGVLLNVIVSNTNLYIHREKSDVSFEITNGKHTFV